MKEEAKPVEESLDAKHSEAPASSTVKIRSSNGFEYLFTIRDDSARNLMFKMKSMEEHYLNSGFTPVANTSFPKREELPTKPCPKHNVPMKDPKGKGFYHSQGTYPNMEYCSGSGFPSEKQPINLASYPSDGYSENGY